jgi:hypothetical protein
MNKIKLFWIISTILYLTGIVALVISLTDIFPGNALKDYSLVVGLAFIFITGLTGAIYRKLK